MSNRITSHVAHTPTEAEIEALAEINLANGWTPNQYRITPCRGGYAVEQFKICLDKNGTPSWIEVCWTRDKKDVERMLARRLGKLTIDLSSGVRQEVVIK